MDVYKFTTHKTGLICLVVIFFFAIITTENYFWLIGVILTLLIITIRVSLGEITRKSEVVFIIIVFSITTLTVILMIFG